MEFLPSGGPGSCGCAQGALRASRLGSRLGRQRLGNCCASRRLSTAGGSALGTGPKAGVWAEDTLAAGRSGGSQSVGSRVRCRLVRMFPCPACHHVENLVAPSLGTVPCVSVKGHVRSCTRRLASCPLGSPQNVSCSEAGLCVVAPGTLRSTPKAGGVHARADAVCLGSECPVSFSCLLARRSARSPVAVGGGEPSGRCGWCSGQGRATGSAGGRCSLAQLCRRPKVGSVWSLVSVDTCREAQDALPRPFLVAPGRASPSVGHCSPTPRRPSWRSGHSHCWPDAPST